MEGSEGVRLSQHPTDKDSVLRFIKRLFKRSVYEESDFDLTDEYILIDLRYDSKDYVAFYQGEILRRYPVNTKLQGTCVTVNFGGG